MENTNCEGGIVISQTLFYMFVFLASCTNNETFASVSKQCEGGSDDLIKPILVGPPLGVLTINYALSFEKYQIYKLKASHRVAR